MNITIHFKLNKNQSEVNFIDVELGSDNLLFVDPRLIENIDNDSLIFKMQQHIEVFWAELIKSVKAKDSNKVRQLMSGLSEPNETRLGYAFNKKFGNSVANELKKKIIEAITSNKAVRTGVLSHFCDTEFIIENVKSDRISDITTKIIKKVLIEYTQSECKKHSIPMRTCRQSDIFNPKTLNWDKEDVELPTDGIRPIIFVPKNIVRTKSGASSNMQCLYRYAVRHFVKNDKNMLTEIKGSGKNHEIQLQDIKQQFPISKRLLTEWIIKYGTLLVDYKSDHLNEKVRPLTDSEIMEIVYGPDFNLNAS